MTETREVKSYRPTGAFTRRVGYTIGIIVNAALLSVINVWPGWRSLTILTESAAAVVSLLNVALIVGIIVNVVYIAVDLRWVKALGDLVTVTLSLAVFVLAWQLFPFEFQDRSIDWALIVRVVLAATMLGCFVAIIVQVVILGRAAFAYGRTGRGPGRQA